MKFSRALWLSAGIHAAAIALGVFLFFEGGRIEPAAPSANIAPMEMTLEGSKAAESEEPVASRREFSAAPRPAAPKPAPVASPVPPPVSDAPPPLPPSGAPELPAPDMPDVQPPDAQPFLPPAPVPAAVRQADEPAKPSSPAEQPREERRESARVDSPAHPRKPIKPDYPKTARLRGEQGRVVLRIRIDGKGRVESAAVAASSGFEELDAAALRAVRSARFVPAKAGGIPVASDATLSLDFKLDR